ncbi:hypothetical protein F5B22DRAFT_607330 [Xylaria bambusicola]|uniref:uncharacterized protein n=1 Tax=Xylaria bambusicola TaxID=326684 RepID=UPI00200889B1|nr:uncharacterized protein F5B22DRAFT_607330 [Xylaria bambusicola]KAI0515426.1 hypothetical protein F5B22DRAFT_607330 [Xylaria bambusicola]
MKRVIACWQWFAGLFKPLRVSNPVTVHSTTKRELWLSYEIESGPTPDQRAENYTRHCRLEGLPPELRRYLLSTLDIIPMMAIIQASPIFYQQYLSDRKFLLCSSLETTLGSAVVDAFFTHFFVTQASLGSVSTDIFSANCRSFQAENIMKQKLTEFVKSYSEITFQRCLPHTLTAKLTEDEAISMARFYVRYVRPLIDYFGWWMLENLAEEAGEDISINRPGITLSRTEMLRLTRAIYRLQILGQVNAANRLVSGHPEDYVEVVLDTFEPWEAEELFSFYQFAHAHYYMIFNDIRWDLHPDNPSFADQTRPPTPSGAFDMDNPMDFDNLLEGTTLRGLRLLHTVLFRLKDHSHLVSIMQEHITRSYIPLNAYEGYFGWTDQELRRRRNPSDRDRMQKAKVQFLFRGDAEPDGPPLAWIRIWKNTYSNLYGRYIPDEMRRWGFVFWDAATLESTRGMEVLERQWRKCWKGEDPRESLSY